MSFKSRCNSWDKNQNAIIPNNYSSLNDSSNLFDKNNTNNVNKIKVIIVGTITPPNKNTSNHANGYFYTSERNKMYELLDNHFKNSNFKCLKDKLVKNPGNQKIIDSIMRELTNHQIAFLDVVKDVKSIPTSAADDKLDNFSLDIGSFEKALCTLKQKTIYFICNSRNAEHGLHIILKNIYDIQSINSATCNIKNNKYTPSQIQNSNIKIFYVPQVPRRYNYNDLCKGWNDVLTKCGV